MPPNQLFGKMKKILGWYRDLRPYLQAQVGAFLSAVCRNKITFILLYLLEESVYGNDNDRKNSC